MDVDELNKAFSAFLNSLDIKHEKRLELMNIDNTRKRLMLQQSHQTGFRPEVSYKSPSRTHSHNSYSGGGFTGSSRSSSNNNYNQSSSINISQTLPYNVSQQLNSSGRGHMAGGNTSSFPYSAPVYSNNPAIPYVPYKPYGGGANLQQQQAPQQQKLSPKPKILKLNVSPPEPSELTPDEVIALNDELETVAILMRLNDKTKAEIMKHPPELKRQIIESYKQLQNNKRLPNKKSPATNFVYPRSSHHTSNINYSTVESTTSSVASSPPGSPQMDRPSANMIEQLYGQELQRHLLYVLTEMNLEDMSVTNIMREFDVEKKRALIKQFWNYKTRQTEMKRQEKRLMGQYEQKYSSSPYANSANSNNQNSNTITSTNSNISNTLTDDESSESEQDEQERPPTPPKTPAWFVTQLSNRNTPLKSLYRYITALRTFIPIASDAWMTEIINYETVSVIPTVHGISCLEVAMERCRQLKNNRDLEIRLALVSTTSSSLSVSGTNPRSSYRNSTMVTGGAGGGGEKYYADDVILDDVLAESVRCLKAIMNNDLGFEAVTSVAQNVLKQLCFCFAVDLDVGKKSLVSLMSWKRKKDGDERLLVEKDEEEDEEDEYLVEKKRKSHIVLKTVVPEVLGPAILLAEDKSEEIYKLILDSMVLLANQQNEPARFEYLVLSLLDPYSPHTIQSPEHFLEEYQEAKSQLEQRRAKLEKREKQRRRRRRKLRLERQNSGAGSDEDDDLSEDEDGDEEDEDDLSDEEDEEEEIDDFDEEFTEDFDLHDEREQREWEYRESILVFINALLDPEGPLEERCRLRSELEERGLRRVMEVLREMGAPDGVADLMTFFEEDRAEDSARIEEMYKEKNAEMVNPIEAVTQLLDQLGNLPDSERLTNLLNTILARVRDVVNLNATITKSATATPLEAQASSNAISEALLLVQTATTAISQAVTSWRHRDAMLLNAKGKVDKAVKSRYQSLATDIVRGLEVAAGSEFELSSVNVPSKMLGGLTQQLQDLQQRYNQAIEELVSHKKEIEHLRRTIQRTNESSTQVPPPRTVSQQQQIPPTVKRSYYDSALANPSSAKLWEEVERLEDLVRQIKRATNESEDGKPPIKNAVPGEQLEFIEKMLIEMNEKRKETKRPTADKDKVEKKEELLTGSSLWAPPPSAVVETKPDANADSSGSQPDVASSPPPTGGPPAPPAPGLPGMGGPPPPPLFTAPAKYVLPKPKKPLKALQWSKLDPFSVQKSIWKDVAKDSYINSNGIASQLGVDEYEVEELFGKVEEAPKKVVVERETPKKKVKKVLLDPKKSKSLGILLAVVRQKVPMQIIRDEIVTVDVHLLTEDILQRLEQNWPSDTDVRKVVLYEGNVDELGEAEQFVHFVGDVPRMAPRLSCIVYKLKFSHELNEILPDVETVISACSELMTSEKLKIVLGRVLVIGNYLNSSSFRGDAHGFSLESLTKLKDIKTNGDKRTPTLLHYVVRQVYRYNSAALQFVGEIPSVELASQIKVGNLSDWMATLRSGLVEVKAEVKLHEQNDWNCPPDDRFLEVMKQFIADAEPRLDLAEEKTKVLLDSLKTTFEFFGEKLEDTPESLFINMRNFYKAWEKARKENESADRKAAKEARPPSKPSGDDATVTSLKFNRKKLLKPVPGQEAFDRRLTVRGGAGPGRVLGGEMEGAMNLMRSGTMRKARKTIRMSQSINPATLNLGALREEDEDGGEKQEEEVLPGLEEFSKMRKPRLGGGGGGLMGRTTRKVVLQVPIQEVAPPPLPPMSPLDEGDDAMVEALQNLVEGLVPSSSAD
ncbi:hypothetical protein HK098_006589 [Nowakowskiella sp. JEL0407]|nr:hypothetical protein HK098_006589 [Nowakowskiella sp. JEL0407]